MLRRDLIKTSAITPALGLVDPKTLFAHDLTAKGFVQNLVLAIKTSRGELKLENLKLNLMHGGSILSSLCDSLDPNAEIKFDDVALELEQQLNIKIPRKVLEKIKAKQASREKTDKVKKRAETLKENQRQKNIAQKRTELMDKLFGTKPGLLLQTLNETQESIRSQNKPSELSPNSKASKRDLLEKLAFPVISSIPLTIKLKSNSKAA